jgi:RNA ligase
VFGFDKIDGSNIRFEWDRKLSKKTHFTNGFGKFGTRQEKIKYDNNPFAVAVEIFMEKYSSDLDRIFIQNPIFRGVEKVTVFGELHGEKSFAGKHDFKGKLDVTMFDVCPYKKDFLPPSLFIETFSHLDIPMVLYSGLFSQDVVDSVVRNDYNVSEGLVFKGAENKTTFMFKVKTQQWLDKVLEMYGEKVMLEY